MISRIVLEDLLIDRNLSTRDAALLLGLGKSTVAYWAKEYSLPISNRRKRADISKKALTKALAKMSNVNAAKKFQCSTRTIVRLKKEYGIQNKRKKKTPAQVKMKARRNKIRAILRQNPFTNRRDLARMVGVDFSTISNDLDSMGLVLARKTDAEKELLKSRLLRGEFISVLKRETGYSASWLSDLRREARAECVSTS